MTCRQSAILVSRELDAKLPLLSRASLGFHIVMCSSCRRYRRQIGAIEVAVGSYLSRAEANPPSLPTTSKESMKALLNRHLDELP